MFKKINQKKIPNNFILKLLGILNGAIVFIIWEEWTDQPGLDIHNSQQYLIDFIAESEDLLAAPIQVYKTTPVF